MVSKPRVIGRIRLARGRTGYYDDLTRIYLNLQKPEANVYSDMNTYNLKSSVSHGQLSIVSGVLSLDEILEIRPSTKKHETPKIEVIEKEGASTIASDEIKEVEEIVIAESLQSENVLGKKVSKK